MPQHSPRGDRSRTTHSRSDSAPRKRGRHQTRVPRELPLAKRIVAIFEEHKGELFKTNEISKMLGIKSEDAAYQELRELLTTLETSGTIVRETRRRYGIPSPQPEPITGTLRVQRNGNAILTPSDSSMDTVLVHSEHLHGAKDGDVVRVSPIKVRRRERPRGEVLEILQRARQPRERDTWMDERHIATRDEGKLQRDPDRQASTEEKDRPRRGRQIALRAPVTIASEMEAIAREYELPGEFPKAVLDEVARIPVAISKEEIARRADLRKKIIFTIDPEDAKDFDDAVSLEELENGNVLLGVHIADVSHYVTEGSALDEEALARGTSVYLVGGVIPMLPEKLSNELCSLRPNEEKLTFSVFLTMNPESGEVLEVEITKSVISSVMRFTYEEAEERTLSGKGKHAQLLRRMRRLSEVMYERRRKEGSIDFESDEVRFRFDEKGTPIESYKKERLGSMRMIEDFMLAANRAIAEVIASKAEQGSERPFLYRIHADPDPAKLRELSVFAKGLGYSLKAERADPKAIQQFLDSVKGKPEEKLLNQLMLRAMAKAVYAEHNVGHFGLAFSHYTHFTSPIRRYPDLIVHRMLFEYISPNGMPRAREHHYFEILPEIADQTSALERRATEAERESIKAALVLLMKQHVGEEFDGIVSGVMPFGLFIVLDSGAEGLLHIRELPGYFEFDEAHHALVERGHSRDRAPRGHGSRGRTRAQKQSARYQLGDKLRVQLVKVLEDRRQMDFKLAEE